MALKPKRSEPKAKGTPGATKPRKPPAGAKSPPRAGAKARPSAETGRATAMAASHLIDQRIRSLGGWRADTLTESFKALIQAAVAENLRSSAPK